VCRREKVEKKKKKKTKKTMMTEVDLRRVGERVEFMCL
jgi:hypothetical protein